MYQNLLPDGGERRQRPRSGPALPMLRFEVPGVQLCLPLEHVERVLPLAARQAIPAGPDHIVGLLNLGGEIVPAIDLCLRLANPAFDYDLDTPVLLCRHRGRRCAIVVAAVHGVSRVDQQGLRRATDVVRDGRGPFLAVFEEADRLVFMLDLDAVCDGLQLDQLAAAEANPA
ncbi:MAG: chemotaxis protein CheW [Pelomonas sp.]|nr:chemotaxis protein CheW [Roseateles sp.]